MVGTDTFSESGLSFSETAEELELPHDPKEWTSADTLAFLKTRKWAPQYFLEEVEREGIDGALLLDLSTIDLISFGVPATRASTVQKRIREVAILGQQAASTSAAPVTPDRRSLIMNNSAASSPLAFAAASSPVAPYTTPTDALLNTTPLDSVLTPRAAKSKQRDYRSVFEMQSTGGSRSTSRRSTFGRTLREAVTTPSAPPRTHSSQPLGNPKSLTKEMEAGEASPSAAAKAKKMVERREHLANLAKEHARRQEQLAMKKRTPTQRRLHAAFQLVDVNSVQALGEPELEDALSIVYPYAGPERTRQVARALLEEGAARDRSGTVNLDEFINSPYAQDMVQPTPNVAEEARKQDRLNAAFRAFDANSSGQIDSGELAKVMTTLFPTLDDAAKVEYQVSITAECDVDHSGKISRTEFVNSNFANLMTRPQPLEATREARKEVLTHFFNSLDTDRTNSLGAKQLSRGLRKRFPFYDNKAYDLMVRMIMAECDQDGDGSISLREFTSSEHAVLMLAVEDYHMNGDPEGALAEDVFHGGLAEARLLRVRDYRMENLNTDGNSSRYSTYSRSSLRTSTPLLNDNLGGFSTPNQLTTGSSASGGPTAEVPSEPIEEDEPGSGPGGLRTAAEEAERMQAKKVANLQRIMSGKSKQVGYAVRQGPLERERRFVAITDLFHRWDETSETEDDASGFIEFDELKVVLAKFFKWTDEEADENAGEVLRKVDSNSDGMLEWSEFVDFMTEMTERVTADQFDDLLRHIHQCVGEVTGGPEYERRDRLLARLFKAWDLDNSSYIDSSELGKVLAIYRRSGDKTVEREVGGAEDAFAENYVDLRGAEAWLESEGGMLGKEEFNKTLQGLCSWLSSEEFDFAWYRLHRAVEQVQSRVHDGRPLIRHRMGMNTQMASTDFPAMLKEGDCSTPFIVHGKMMDPSRAVEMCAQQMGRSLEPCVILHTKAATKALKVLKVKGFQMGWWVLLLLDSDHDPDTFLREVAVLLKTENRRMNQGFRLWISTSQDSIATLPPVLLNEAVVRNVDKIELLASQRQSTVHKYMSQSGPST